MKPDQPQSSRLCLPALLLFALGQDAKGDPAVNCCTMGTVIGHELTHGFDSSGRLYDAKANEGATRQNLSVDGHPPGVYRMAAPSQHEQGHYDAFGIRAGHRMWLAPNRRVAIW
jgi:predicted metalloendopeptidase